MKINTSYIRIPKEPEDRLFAGMVGRSMGPKDSDGRKHFVIGRPPHNNKRLQLPRETWKSRKISKEEYLAEIEPGVQGPAGVQGPEGIEIPFGEGMSMLEEMTRDLEAKKAAM